MKTNEIILENQIITEGVISSLRQFWTDFYSKMKSYIPLSKEVKSTVDTNKEDVAKMFEKFAQLRKQGKLDEKSVASGMASLATDIAKEYASDHKQELKLNEDSGRAVVATILGGGYSYLLFQFVDFMLKLGDAYSKTGSFGSNIINYGLKHSSYGDISFLGALAQVPGLWALIAGVVSLFVAMALKSYASGEDPDPTPVTKSVKDLKWRDYAWSLYINKIGLDQVPQNIHDDVLELVNNPPSDWVKWAKNRGITPLSRLRSGEQTRSTAPKVDNQVLMYALYLYALQQMYGQDTSNAKTAIQKYVQSTGDRTGVNSQFNSIVSKLKSSQESADRLAQDFLKPQTARNIIDNLYQALGTQHEEF